MSEIYQSDITANGVTVFASDYTVGFNGLGQDGRTWVVVDHPAYGKTWYLIKEKEAPKMNTDLEPLAHALGKTQAVANLTQASVLLEKEQTVPAGYSDHDLDEAEDAMEDLLLALIVADKALTRLKALPK